MGGCFLTGRDVIILRNTLEEMVNPQPITQGCTDNTTAAGIANDTVKEQRSRATNMHYFWIRDQKPLKNII